MRCTTDYAKHRRSARRTYRTGTTSFGCHYCRTLFFKDYPDGDTFIEWLDGMASIDIPRLSLPAAPTHDDVIAALERRDINVQFTSGTSGRFSFVPRDEASERRLKYSWLKAIFELMEYRPDAKVMLLTPDPHTHLTIARVFGYAYHLFKDHNVQVAMKNTQVTTEFLKASMGLATGVGGKLKSKLTNLFGPAAQKHADKKMIKLLEEWEGKGSTAYIAGPPFWLDRIMRRMEEYGKRVSLSDSSQVLTGGGWKVHEDRRPPEEAFREKVERYLGIPENRYRDVYAMTECSSLFQSCEGHYKHIPPHIHPFVLDDDLNPVGYGEFGRLAFLDPLPASYPGFIMTGDRVRLMDHCPECERPGPVLDVEVRRLPGVEGRGCATVTAELMRQEA